MEDNLQPVILLAKKISELVYADRILGLFGKNLLFFCKATNLPQSHLIYFSSKRNNYVRIADSIYEMKIKEWLEDKNFEIVLGVVVYGKDQKDALINTSIMINMAKDIGISLEIARNQKDSYSFYKKYVPIIEDGIDIPDYENLIDKIPDFMEETIVIPRKYQSVLVKEIYRYNFVYDTPFLDNDGKFMPVEIPAEYKHLYESDKTEVLYNQEFLKYDKLIKPFKFHPILKS